MISGLCWNDIFKVRTDFGFPVLHCRAFPAVSDWMSEWMSLSHSLFFFYISVGPVYSGAAFCPGLILHLTPLFTQSRPSSDSLLLLQILHKARCCHNPASLQGQCSITQVMGSVQHLAFKPQFSFWLWQYKESLWLSKSWNVMSS